MPESRKRKKKSSPAPARQQAQARRREPSPPWYGALTLGLLLVAVIWLICYTIGPVPGQGALGGWNYAVAVGLLLVGVGMLTNWR